MSNEEQMRAEFYAAYPRYAGVLEMEEAGAISHLDAIAAKHCFAAWKAATANKQREIDALNQQVLELSAQVAEKDAALTRIRCEWDEMYPEDIGKEIDSALSTTPPAALEAHDNEVAAKALDHASDHEGLYDKRDVLRRMAAELRSKK